STHDALASVHTTISLNDALSILPARLSNTAGTFVCNHILYQLGFLQATQFPNIKFGFIHVPFIPQQVTDKPEKPSMSIQTIQKRSEEHTSELQSRISLVCRLLHE